MLEASLVHTLSCKDYVENLFQGKKKKRDEKARREIRIITVNEIDIKNSYLNLWL